MVQPRFSCITEISTIPRGISGRIRISYVCLVPLFVGADRRQPSTVVEIQAEEEIQELERQNR
jgi:hypothetical protein